MTRFRALLFGEPIAPWQATKELAEQAAIEAGEASRDAQTGWIYLSPGVAIEEDAGEPPALTPDMERWAEAFAVLRMHQSGAEAFIAERMEDLKHDAAGRARWRAIGKRLAMIRDAAEKDAIQ